MYYVKDCLTYLTESSRTCDLCLWVREQVTKDANGHAAVNLDLTLDQWETGKIQTKKQGNLFITFSITSLKQGARPNSHCPS